jgi:dTDP-4-dehydrorhamnose reductase
MPVCPASVYGKSKLAGEEVLSAVCPESVIIRTSWLYSSFGNNFVKTMMRLGEERDSLNVVFDQVGTPTYAADLAVAIFEMLSANDFVAGIYHFSDEGVCSWYDFTIAIHRKSGISCKVLPIESSQYPAKTPRPHYSVLNKAKIKSVYGIQIPHWEDSLGKCISILTSK